jgi:hypothetical protein
MDRKIPGSAILMPACAVLCFLAINAAPSHAQPFIVADAQKLTEFGTSAAVDGNTLVFGEHEVGVHVFVRSGNVWVHQQTLGPSSGPVALDGDTLIVGARSDDEAANDAGAAYVFVRSGGTWTEQDKLLASDAASLDHFGSSVDVKGDVAVIGAPDRNGVSSDNGAVYVFRRSAGVWSEEQQLTSPSPIINGNLGETVAIDGTTFITGEPKLTSPTHNRVHVFVESVGVWSHQAELTPPHHPFNDDGFGLAVALDADTAVIATSGCARE